ncbi:MAG: hypothetical protein IJ849_07185 [Selenomonadaceae bacterium]|nr:hypothetical protein [Selenomonadaceae bacterium]
MTEFEQEVLSLLKSHGTALEALQRDMTEVKQEQARQGAVIKEMSATLKRHEAILQEHSAILKEHSAILQEHSAILKEHSAILQEHSATLQEHSATLKEHSATLKEMNATLKRHEAILKEHSVTLKSHDVAVADLKAEQKAQREKLDAILAGVKENSRIMLAAMHNIEMTNARVDGMELSTANVEMVKAVKNDLSQAVESVSAESRQSVSNLRQDMALAFNELSQRVLKATA